MSSGKLLTWLEISKSALIHNLKEFRKIIGLKIKLMAVVKSNAYGHGLVNVAKIIEKKVDYFGVANLDEALELRKNGLKKPILILTYWLSADSCGFFNNRGSTRIYYELEKAVRKNIEFVVYTYPQAKILSKIRTCSLRSQNLDFSLRSKLSQNEAVKIHLKIDTGTSRIGILPENSLDFALKCLKLPSLKIKGIFTHFAKSEAANQKYTLLQTQRLARVGEILAKNCINYGLCHAACTAATIVNSATHFDMVRIGIGLYGLWPSPETKKLAQKLGKKINLKPALTWKTKVIQVKELPKCTAIGYGCTYRLKNKGKIAILPIGYWDGYDRKLSNLGEVLIRSRRVPIRGRVCMNLMMVEVTKIPGVKVGDEVVLIGKQGNEEITTEELAEKVGTINYEVVTRINPVLPRIYR